MYLKAITLSLVAMFGASSVQAYSFDPWNWRRLQDYTPRDIGHLSEREQAELIAGTQVGVITTCGGQLSAVLVEVQEELFVFTNRHGAMGQDGGHVSLGETYLPCPEGEFAASIRFYPDAYLARHKGGRGKAVKLQWPPYNLHDNRFDGSEFVANNRYDDWIVFRLDPDQPDLRDDVLPLTKGGANIRRGAMKPVTRDLRYDHARLPITLFSFSSDYDGMLSASAQDCSGLLMGGSYAGLDLYGITHFCDTAPGSSGSALTVFEAETGTFNLIGLNAQSNTSENSGPSIYSIAIKLMGKVKFRFSNGRDLREMPEDVPIDIDIGLPLDRRSWDKIAFAPQKTVNVRAGRSTDTAVRGQLSPGQFMYVQPCVESWCPVVGEITTPEGEVIVEGFVHGSVIDISDLAGQMRPYTYIGGEKARVETVEHEPVYEGNEVPAVRVDSWGSHPPISIGTVKPGETVTVLNCRDGWCLVYGKYEGSFGRSMAKNGVKKPMMGWTAWLDAMYIRQEAISAEPISEQRTVNPVQAVPTVPELIIPEGESFEL